MTDRPWRYAVGMKHPKTGETRVAIVELTDAEQRDAIAQWRTRDLVEAGYAMRAAEKQLPGFWAGGEIERVVLH